MYHSHNRPRFHGRVPNGGIHHSFQSFVPSFLPTHRCHFYRGIGLRLSSIHLCRPIIFLHIIHRRFESMQNRIHWCRLLPRGSWTSMVQPRQSTTIPSGRPYQTRPKRESHSHWSASRIVSRFGEAMTMAREIVPPIDRSWPDEIHT